MMKPLFGFHALALGVAAACLSLPAWSLDLAQAYRLALDQDSTIRAARAAADAGRERLPQARAQFFPVISASASRHRNDLDTTAPDALGRLSTTNDKYTSSSEALTLRQPIFRKQLGAQYRQAQALVADADALLEREEQNLVVRVTQAYFETLQAQEQLVLVGLQKTAFSTQVDAARKGFAAGSGTRTDIDEAQARLDLTLAQELEARQNIDLARRQLQVLINRPVLQPVAPVDVGRLPQAPMTPASVEEWTALAEASSPELQSARAQVDAARADVEKAQAGHYPTLDAVAQISRSDSENITRINSQFRQKQIGLQLAVPLYQGGYVNSQVREALALLERAQNRLEELRRDLGVRVHREFRGVTEGVVKVKALEQAVRSTEQLAVSSRRSFEAGARTPRSRRNSSSRFCARSRSASASRTCELT
ncbi:MAG: channel protein TolC [Comamonadaceae bacterium]|nr:MAG: channel protein TolC [Comamonadaceae bacterium]